MSTDGREQKIVWNEDIFTVMQNKRGQRVVSYVVVEVGKTIPLSRLPLKVKRDPRNRRFFTTEGNVVRSPSDEQKKVERGGGRGGEVKARTPPTSEKADLERMRVAFVELQREYKRMEKQLQDCVRTMTDLNAEVTELREAYRISSRTANGLFEELDACREEIKAKEREERKPKLSPELKAGIDLLDAIFTVGKREARGKGDENKQMRTLWRRVGLIVHPDYCGPRQVRNEKELRQMLGPLATEELLSLLQQLYELVQKYSSDDFCKELADAWEERKPV